MTGIADWVVRMFCKQLRRLGPDQIRDLIKGADDPETLEVLQAHLISEDFMYWHGMMTFKKELLEEIGKKLMEMGAFQ
jgi:hypothetical protein